MPKGLYFVTLQHDGDICAELIERMPNDLTINLH